MTSFSGGVGTADAAERKGSLLWPHCALQASSLFNLVTFQTHEWKQVYDQGGKQKKYLHKFHNATLIFLILWTEYMWTHNPNREQCRGKVRNDARSPSAKETNERARTHTRVHTHAQTQNTPRTLTNELHLLKMSSQRSCIPNSNSC